MPIAVLDENDRDLVADCAAGDALALEALYQRHGGACLAHARRVVIDSHLAQDIVQEAFLELWRHASRFDGQRSSVRTWLIMLTHRRSVDRVRSEQRRRTEELTADGDRADGRRSPESQAVVAALGEAIQQALDALSPARREPLVLAYWGGLTQNEIAQRTGTPLGTVKTRTAAAMRELRPLIAQAGWSPEGAA